MATKGNRDVKMTLSVETLGADEIKKLQTSVAQLAQEGGEAAPEFQKLADEIGRLGEQAQAILAFRQLADETERLSTKQAEASQRFDQLQAKLTEASTATAQAAQRQREAQTAYNESKAALADINGQLTILRNSYDASGKRVANYKSELERLTRAKVEQKRAVDLNKTALTEANVELRKAESEQGKLETSVRKANAALESTNKALSSGKSALEEQRKVTESIGVSTEDLAKSQAELVQALNRTGQAAWSLKTNLDQARAAEKALADEARRAADAYDQQIKSINAEIKLRQQAAAERVAAAQKAAAAEKAAEEASATAARDAYNERLRSLNAEIALRQQAAHASSAATKAAYDEQVRSINAEIQLRKQAAAESAAAAQRSAEAISNAFEKVGVRGAAAIRQEIAEVRNAMQLLATKANLTGDEIASAMTAGNARIRELERELRSVTNQTTLADRAAQALKNSMGQITVGNLVADGIAFLVEKVKEMGRQFIEVSIQSDTMRRALNALYRDSEVTAQQMDFLRKVAQASGVSISGITSDFIRFSAATKASNIPLQDTNAVFAAVTKAAGSLGLGAERTGLALNALGQIASKGVVTMEELRQQLGDSIPGALSLTAKGLGVTDAQLIKLVESGQLAARDFFPAFAKGLQELEGDTNSLRNNWERFKNSLTISAQAASEAGALELLSVGVKGLGIVLGTITLTLSAFVEGLLSAGNALLYFYEVLSEGRQKAWDNLNNRMQATNERLTRQTNALRDMISPNQDLQAALGKTADVNRQLATSSSEATQAILDNIGQIQEAARQASNTQLGQQALAEATRTTANAASQAGAAWTQLNTAMAQLTQAANEQIVVAGKEVAAAETQAKTIERLAALRGDEVSKMDAAVQAANVTLAALENEALKRQQLVDVLSVQLAEQVRLATQQDGNIEQRRNEIIEIQKKLDLATVEAQRSKEAVANAQAELAARTLTRQMYEDNSRAVDQLRAAMESANTVAAITVDLERQGLATKEQVAAANETAAIATALYNDALRDQQANMRALNDLQRVDYSLKEMGVKVLIAQKQAEMEVARAKGETARVAKLQNELRQLEIELIRVGIEAKRAEAQSIIAAANAERARLEATGQMTEAQRAAIEASIKKAEVMLKEAEIAEITAQKLEELAKMTDRVGESADRASNNYDKLAGSLQNVASAAEKASAAQSKASESGGVGGARGGAFGVSSYGLVLRKARLGTLDQSDYELVKRALEESQSQADTATTFGFRNSQDAVAIANEIRQIFNRMKSSGTKATDFSAQGQPTQNTGSQPMMPSPTSVTINLNGAMTRVNVASDADAQALTSLFQQLESSAGRTY